MISINSDGYIQDEEGIMYPITNVLSIKWKQLDKICKIGTYDKHYQMWFDKEEIDKMEDWK